MENLVVIAGPTASGKSALSVMLAEKINGEIISADSMQVYKDMDIGTAKVTLDEMKNIPHHMIDVFSPAEDFNVSIFSKKAVNIIYKIQQLHKIPILVGGSGLYIDSVVFDNYIFPVEGLEENKVLIQQYERLSNDELYALLVDKSPQLAAQVHPNNRKRVVRMLVRSQRPENLHIKKHREYRFKNTVYFALNMDRGYLYERINKRVDIMFKQGLIEEVKKLLEKGYDLNCKSMLGIGYKETVQYLNGKLTLQDTKDLIKKNSRHFAKRQFTWFRRNENIHWINLDLFQDEEQILSHMTDIIEKEMNRKSLC